MDDSYNRRQRDAFDVSWQRYNLAEIRLPPAQQFYSTIEHADAVTMLPDHGAAEICRLLVCGVGGGTDLEFWLRHLKVRRCIGVDLSAEGIKACQRRILHNRLPNIIEYIQADMEGIPLRDNSVDLGIVVYTLHHTSNPRRAFRELFRVSRNGLVVIEPANTFLMPFFKWIGLAKSVEDAGNVVHRFRKGDYQTYLKGETYYLRFRRCLAYYHPLIHRCFLPLFYFRGGVFLLKVIHWTTSIVLFPLRTKGLAVVEKQRDRRE